MLLIVSHTESGMNSPLKKTTIFYDTDRMCFIKFKPGFEYTENTDTVLALLLVACLGLDIMFSTFLIQTQSYETAQMAYLMLAAVGTVPAAVFAVMIYRQNLKAKLYGQKINGDPGLLRTFLTDAVFFAVFEIILIIVVLTPICISGLKITRLSAYAYPFLIFFAESSLAEYRPFHRLIAADKLRKKKRVTQGKKEAGNGEM